MTRSGAGYITAVNAFRGYGGRERWTVGLLAELQTRGHRVRFFCAPENLERVQAAGVPAEPVRLGGDVMVHHAAAFARTLRRHQPDALLVAHFGKVWLAGLAARFARVPRVVARVAVADYRPDSLKYRFALTRLLDATVVNSEEMRRDWLRQYPRLARTRFLTVYKGVRPARDADPSALRGELGLAGTTPLIGCVARLHPHKRIDRIVEAAARLDGVHAVLIGDGPHRGALESLARALDVSERVHFLGERNDVRRLLPGLDLYLLTSSSFESMNTSVLEALWAGVPVVTTPTSGMAEALEVMDGAPPGVLVEPEPAAIASAVRTLLEDAKLRRRMSAAARRVARERFDFERMVLAWEALLLEPLPPPPGP